jgi:hypothetical protein
MSYPTQPVVGQNLELTNTTPQQQLGQKIQANDGNYMYVQASGAIAQGAACKIDDDYQAAELTTTISGAEPTKVGIAQIAFADNEYGWIFVGPGSCSVLALTLCAADVKVYTTATAGAIDDTATDLIQGLKLLTTVGGSTALTTAYATQELTTNAQD